jgi:hypothetical protein
LYAVGFFAQIAYTVSLLSAPLVLLTATCQPSLFFVGTSLLTDTSMLPDEEYTPPPSTNLPAGHV